MDTLFVWLSEKLSGSAELALTASFLWGILSILLSPCHLASIPLIVGFINGQGIVTKKRAFILSALFSVGILLTIAVIGLITGMMGRIMGDVGKTGNYIVAVIFFVIGLHLLEIINLPFPGMSNQPKMKKKGALAAFVIGLLFGIAFGPARSPIWRLCWELLSMSPRPVRFFPAP
ncbi:MAG: cytochrome c biogenesis protein CcdA [candidate division KSB1 bacterium]|nr:cytochrome c biogenesis protein CcdA [candidate division KSB1 bacterium]